MAAVLIAALFSTQTSFLKSLKRIELAEARLEMRRDLLKNLSCKATLNPNDDPPPLAIPPPGCDPLRSITTPTGKKTLPLFGVTAKNGTPYRLTSDTGKIERWEVLATCTNNGIEISLTQPSLTTALVFELDPVLKVPLDLSHPSSKLFNAGSALCGEYFAPRKFKPKRMETSGGSVVASKCSPPPLYNAQRDGCAHQFYEDVVFSKPFSSPPEVVVVLTDSVPFLGVPHCSSGSVMMLSSFPSSVTKTGFRLFCSAYVNQFTLWAEPYKSACTGCWIPPYACYPAPNWNNYPGWAHAACSWIAVGEGEGA